MRNASFATVQIFESPKRISHIEHQQRNLRTRRNNNRYTSHHIARAISSRRDTNRTPRQRKPQGRRRSHQRSPRDTRNTPLQHNRPHDTNRNRKTIHHAPRTNTTSPKTSTSKRIQPTIPIQHNNTQRPRTNIPRTKKRRTTTRKNMGTQRNHSHRRKTRRRNQKNPYK